MLGSLFNVLSPSVPCYLFLSSSFCLSVYMKVISGLVKLSGLFSGWVSSIGRFLSHSACLKARCYLSLFPYLCSFLSPSLSVPKAVGHIYPKTVMIVLERGMLCCTPRLPIFLSLPVLFFVFVSVCLPLSLFQRRRVITGTLKLS